MSPLDDELRSLFRSRAAVLAPAADPLAGIERRARRMRRNRMTASVTGTALVVAAIALAVPALVTDKAGDDVQRFATPGPSAAASPSPVASDKPVNAVYWPTVGGSSPLDEATRAAWANDHQVSPADVTAEVLYRGTTGDRGEVVAYQLWTATTPARIVIATADNGRALLLTDEPAADVNAYRAIVPGLATPWEAVVASPTTVKIEYAENGVDFVPQPDRRTALFARTGPTGAVADQIRTTDAKGFSVVQPANPPGATDGGADADPVNLLASWPTRGGHAQDDLIPLLEKTFATGRARPRDAVRSRVLFSGATTTGLRYVFGQAWFAGEQTAYNVGYTTGGQQGPEPFLGPATRPGAKVLAFLVCCPPGATTETVVVIPAPGVAQVLYSASPQARFVPVGQGQSGYDGVVLIERNQRAQGDRIQLLEGNGAAPTYTGEVMKLLCGLSGCG